MKLTLLVYCLSTFIVTSQAQPTDGSQEITLEAIFADNLLQQETVSSIRWMNDGRYYTAQVSEDTAYYQHILRYDVTTGEAVDTLVNGRQLLLRDSPDNPALAYDNYELSPREDKVLFATELEPIYRRSRKAYYYVYDLTTGDFQPLADGGKQSYATFSPDGSHVAFVRDNNLYYASLADGSVTAVTQDGKKNELIHGSTDWVYEEEFGFTKAFHWSPNSDQLAFISFDESQVAEYNMQEWGDLYPRDGRFKYPKAGEGNSKVGVSVYHLPNKKTVAINVGSETDIYLPRVQWTTDNNVLSIVRMNRLQNQLDILHADATTGKAEVVLTEESDTYIDVNYNNDLTYLSDGQRFVYTSERDGYKHIYLYTVTGELVQQVTQGDWEVSELAAIDEERQLMYYLSTEASPLEQQLYSVNWQGKKQQRLSEEPGTHSVDFSPDARYYVDRYSSVEHPLVVELHQAPAGKTIRTLEDNQALREAVAEYTWGTREEIAVPVGDSVTLNGYLIKPADFDSTKRYPLLMFVYGGPGSQMVTSAWMSDREGWFHVLAQRGYLVACVDNRGTGGRGCDFSHATYAQLGKLEVQDQIASAKHLGQLPYVDADRIGIWGWSYGGYMSSLALFMGNDVFKAGIAVAPVTSWRFYDSVYTERYLQTPQLNAEGYDRYSPLSHADKLRGNFLLVHGTGDDNVHFQNAVMLQDALIAANKQFDSFYYPNRNHGIYGGNTRLHLFTMMTDFVEEKL
ncbi:MAG: S9 family peptidase [Tunicatimonas sp.]